MSVEKILSDWNKQRFKPVYWLEGEEEALEVLLARLLKRRGRVPDLIEDSRRGRVNPFPNWR